MNQDPVAGVPADEAEVEAAHVEEPPVEESPVDEPPIEEPPVETALVDDELAPRTAARAVDRACDVDDDFWTAAASEQSVPTRKVVYGARSTDGGSKRHRWFKSLRHHRR